MAFIFKSLLTSWLQLKRDRPSSHAGKLYRIDDGGGEGMRGAPPPQGLEVQAGGVQFSVLAPVPPCYDPELAGLLRTVCMVFGSGRGLPVGARAFPVLVGSTLANWYHLGSQVPWKQQIHLAVAVAGCPWPARQVASRATADLRRALGAGEAASPFLQRAVFTEEDGVLEWTVRGRRKDRPTVLVVIRLQVTPERAADLPALSQLRRVAIDGGNTGVFIPGTPRELTAALREVGKDAAARLEMPREWYWCAEESAFVRPGIMARALQWPPNVATAKVVVAAVVFMLVVYGLTMMALPEWGSHLRKREALRRNAAPLISGSAPSLHSASSPSASASPATRTT